MPRPGGGTGRPPHFSASESGSSAGSEGYVSFEVSAPSLRIESPGASPVIPAARTESPLTSEMSRRLFGFPAIPPHSREVEFMSLGLQSYSPK